MIGDLRIERVGCPVTRVVYDSCMLVVEDNCIGCGIPE